MKRNSSNQKNDLVTQSDLEEWGNTLVDRINAVENAVTSSKNEILNRIDGFTKRISDLDDENAAGNLHFKRVDAALANHDKRIQKLESA